MKAVIWTKYGDTKGLVYTDVEKPIPKDNEVLIKVAATNVFAGDCELRSLKINPLFVIPLRLFFGFRRPKDVILGQEYSGTIEAVGKDVVGLSVGQNVFGNTAFNFGTYAEYLCLPADSKGIIILDAPKSIPLKHAAVLSIGALETWHFLGKLDLKGKHLLINGAGGSIGAIAIQYAKLHGAEVTAVDASHKLEALLNHGADHVIDYAKEAFTDHKDRYDIVFDVVGKSKFIKTAKALKQNGAYLIANPKLFNGIKCKVTQFITGVKIYSKSSKINRKALEYVRDQIESGQMTVLIDREMHLSQMREAHDYVDSGKKIGNLLIRIEEDC